MDEHKELILDGTKINWHLDRVQAWERGERIAPITIDGINESMQLFLYFVMQCFKKMIEKNY